MIVHTSMGISSEEIAYAENQLIEADRRLQTMYQRGGEEVEVHIFNMRDRKEPLTIRENPDEDSRIGGFDDLIKPSKISSRDTKTELQISEDNIEDHIQNIIIDSQLSIELSVKAMFKLTGKDHPFSHGISFSDGATQGFYHEVPDDFDRKEDIARVIFLTRFWGEFYELAKYGAPKLNLPPEELFTVDDGVQALDDAEFCLNVAKDFLSFVKNQT